MTTSQVGLLVLTLPLRSAFDSISHHLKWAGQTTIKRLYIKLEPDHERLWPISVRNSIDLAVIARLIPAVYEKATVYCKDLDVRLFLNFNDKGTPRPPVDIILTDSNDDEENIRRYVHEHFSASHLSVVKTKHASDYISVKDIPKEEPFNVYRTVVLGGTFDRLHNGHKVLLSSAALRTSKKLIVGVTDGIMLRRKKLWELIEPVNRRICQVSEFLNDIKPALEYSVVPITDPFGPSVEDPEIDCIIVSHETSKGGNSVNSERIKRGLKELEMHVIDLVEDPNQEFNDEFKISSSSIRKQLLGTYIKEPQPKYDLTGSMRIALFGGLVNEVSCIVTYMKTLGAEIINCNEIISDILISHREAYQQIVQQFGEKIVDTNGAIIPKYLQLIPFMIKLKKELLEIVLKQAQSVIDEKLEFYNKQGISVIVLQSCHLMQNQILSSVHQIWTSVMSESETIKKLKKIHGLSDQEALQIASAGSPDLQVIQQSNVVFSPEWDEEFTKQQVQTSWSQLQKFLKARNIS